MNNSSHPSSLLKQKVTDSIREGAAKAEKDGRLTRAQLNLIADQQWLKALMPVSYDGTQTSLPDALQLQEAIAWADGSAGWVVTSCALGGWYSGFADSETAKKIFSDSKVCIACGAEPTGTAEKTKTGFKASGKWQHVAAVSDATAFIANCVVTHSGASAKEKAQGQVLTFLLLKSEVTIDQSWNAMGLSASGSNSFEVKDLVVTADRAFKSDAPKSTHPLYTYPMAQMAEAALAVNVSGMAIHFLDICTELFAKKKNPAGIALNHDNMVNDVVEKYSQRFYDARAKLFYALELSWQSCVNNQPIKPSTAYKVSASAYDLAKRARECADALYPFCGMEAADESSDINRVWRDLHTACQHSLLVFGGVQD